MFCWLRRIHGAYFPLALLLFVLISEPAIPAQAQSARAPVTDQAGQREVFMSTSPLWLLAVGKLEVPGIKFERGYQRNHRENCSATLVTKSAGNRADTIITAWHCLEFYTDLSKTITFTLFNGHKRSFSTEAYRLVDGGGMDADWAVMRLRQSVPASVAPALKLHPEKANAKRPITMAGYSNDSLSGGTGDHLSYDPACTITRQAAARGRSESNCAAMKGASGGAVIQLSADGEPLLAGVISQGNGRDFSVFVPVEDFRKAIIADLR